MIGAAPNALLLPISSISLTRMLETSPVDYYTRMHVAISLNNRLYMPKADIKAVFIYKLKIGLMARTLLNGLHCGNKSKTLDNLSKGSQPNCTRMVWLLGVDGSRARLGKWEFSLGMKNQNTNKGAAKFLRSCSPFDYGFTSGIRNTEYGVLIPNYWAVASIAWCSVEPSAPCGVRYKFDQNLSKAKYPIHGSKAKREEYMRLSRHQTSLLQYECISSILVNVVRWGLMPLILYRS